MKSQFVSGGSEPRIPYEARERRTNCAHLWIKIVASFYRYALLLHPTDKLKLFFGCVIAFSIHSLSAKAVTHQKINHALAFKGSQETTLIVKA